MNDTSFLKPSKEIYEQLKAIGIDLDITFMQEILSFYPEDFLKYTK